MSGRVLILVINANILCKNLAKEIFFNIFCFSSNKNYYILVKDVIPRW